LSPLNLASIQARVVNLRKDLRKNRGLSYLFVSHDPRIVELLSYTVACHFALYWAQPTNQSNQ
jgi:ABC-type dipeptide/oligopeptide/nickel transport system ATPase subunit